MTLLLNRENMLNTSHSGLSAYLMKRIETTYRHLISICLSALCLFDGYLTETVFSSQNQSQGQNVQDSSLAFKREFYRTFTNWKSSRSYLTTKLLQAVIQPIKHCRSSTLLFDGHLMIGNCFLLIFYFI